MTLRRQILLAAWAAGGIFTLMLVWMAYFTHPFPIPGMPTILAATAVVLLFWWLVANYATRIIETRINLAVNAMKKRMDEMFALRKKLQGQQAAMQEFTNNSLPLAEQLNDQACVVADQSAVLARTKTPTNVTNHLLQTSDALQNEIRVLLDEARTANVQADILRHDLTSLAALQPLLTVQMEELESVARRFSILALNAAIESARAPNGGDRVLVREIRQLSGYAETIANALQEHLARLSESATRSCAIAAPLADHTRAVLAASETLDQMADEQWDEMATIHRDTESVSADAGLAALRFRLVESATEVARHGKALKQSIEKLASSLGQKAEAA